MDDLVPWLGRQLDDDEAMLDALDSTALNGIDSTAGWGVREYVERLPAEVDAKRQILELHRPIELKATAYRPAMLQCEHCAGLCHSRSGLGCDEPIDAPWPCPTIRLLALPYAGRPGYREEWRR